MYVIIGIDRTGLKFPVMLNTADSSIKLFESMEDAVEWCNVLKSRHVWNTYYAHNILEAR